MANNYYQDNSLGAEFLRFFRWLRSMKTAIGIMAIIAFFCLLGAILPQDPSDVAKFYQSYSTLAPILNDLGLFSVFTQWWFLFLVVLLVVSLSSCLYQRYRGYFAMMRVAVARRHQAKIKWQTAISKFGSLALHSAILLIIAGAAYGKIAGYGGQIALLPGVPWTNTQSEYDEFHQGLLSPNLPNFQLKLLQFYVRFYKNGTPSYFDSKVAIIQNGRTVGIRNIKVNQPLNWDGINFYLNSYGWAPILVLSRGNQKLFDGPIVTTGSPFLSNGVLKVPGAGPPGDQIGATMAFTPDYAAPRLGGQELKNPVLFIQVYKGNLQLNKPQSVFDINLSEMHQIWIGKLKPGQHISLPGGYVLSFPTVERYSALSVNYDPGFPIIIAAFLIAGLGLIARFYLPLIGGKKLDLSPKVQPEDNSVKEPTEGIEVGNIV